MEGIYSEPFQIKILRKNYVNRFSCGAVWNRRGRGGKDKVIFLKFFGKMLKI